MPTVTENVDLPGDVDPARCTVELQLYQADRTPLKEARNQVTGETVAGRRVVTLDAAGVWTEALTGNVDLLPAGSVWGRRLRAPRVDSTLSYATVAASGGPYQWKVIETDPPAALTSAALAAHAASSSLHGGGRRLAIAHLAANFTTASITYVDIPGATCTFTVPANGKFVAEAWLPLLVEEAARTGDIRMVFGAVPSIITADTVRSAAANQAMSFHLRAALPAPIWTPTASSTQTVKLQMKTSVATSDLSVFVDFAGLQNLAYLEIYAMADAS